MLDKLLEYIRQQPRATRDMYALSGAIVSTVLVGFIWLGYLSTTPEPYFNTAAVTTSQSNETTTEKKPEQASAPPFSGLWKQFSALWEDVEEETVNFDTEENNSNDEIEVEYIKTKPENTHPVTNNHSVQIISTDSRKEEVTESDE